MNIAKPRIIRKVVVSLNLNNHHFIQLADDGVRASTYLTYRGTRALLWSTSSTHFRDRETVTINEQQRRRRSVIREKQSEVSEEGGNIALAVKLISAGDLRGRVLRCP